MLNQSIRTSTISASGPRSHRGLTRGMLFAMVVALTIGVSSCTQGTVGIFASLGRETKITDRGLSNYITPLAMAQDSGYYYMAAGAVYVRATNSTSWTEVSPPASGLIPTGLTIDTTNNIVYAVYYDNQSGSGYQVYTRSPDGTTTASGWTATGFKSDGTTIQKIGGLFYEGSNVFASVKLVSTYPSYELYYYNGSNFAAITGSSSGSPVVAGTYDGTTDWFVSNGDVFLVADTTPSGGASAPATIPQTSGYVTNYQGIYYDASNVAGSNTIWLTAGGALMSTTDGGSTWTVNVASQVGPDGSTDLSLTRLSAVYNTDFKALLVGTKSHGYYLYEPSVSTTSFQTINVNSNYEATDLHTSAVNMIYVDTAPVQTTTNDKPSTPSNVQLVFMGAVSYGMWETYYTANSSSEVPTWIQD